MMAKMSELAGLSNQNTNHSLRATAYTKMYNAGIPEKIIAHFSGHRSSKTTEISQFHQTYKGGWVGNKTKIEVIDDKSSGESNFQNCTVKTIA